MKKLKLQHLGKVDYSNEKLEPIFQIITAEGEDKARHITQHIKIYLDGRVEGIPNASVINGFPILFQQILIPNQNADIALARFITGLGPIPIQKRYRKKSRVVWWRLCNTNKIQKWVSKLISGTKQSNICGR
jgi:hypothetical protein